MVVQTLDFVIYHPNQLFTMSNNEKITLTEKRLDAIESFLKPTEFRKVEVTNVFPIHHEDMPEEVEIRILAYLTASDYLLYKTVCK